MEITQNQRHISKVQSIARAVRDHAETSGPGEYFSLRKATVSHTVPQPADPKNRDRKIDVTELTEIIRIDPEKWSCTAESGVSFEQLVRETIKFGLIPKTVSELKTITIGGAVAGCSVESMSYRYGGFHDSCTAYEVINGKGEIITCSREEDSELFEMVHGSFGTLGILTALQFELIPAQPFVKMEYRTYTAFSDLMKAVRTVYEERNYDFMDAIVHGPRQCVLCLGNFSDSAPYTSEYFTRPFYRSTASRTEDYLKTPDYLFRYDADCHWIVRNYGLENPILRTLFGKFFLGSSKLLSLAKRLPFLENPDAPDVVADVFIPFRNMDHFFSWYQQTFDYYPLWVVPYHIDRMYPWVNPAMTEGTDDSLYIDCAIYGYRQKGGRNYYKELEKKVAGLKGIKTLITNNYYSEQEFWQSYNRPVYEKVKSRTDPRNIFRNIYFKTNYRSGKPQKERTPPPTAG